MISKNIDYYFNTLNFNYYIYLLLKDKEKYHCAFIITEIAVLSDNKVKWSKPLVTETCLLF
jgi:hypothetical protein